MNCEDFLVTQQSRSITGIDSNLRSKADLIDERISEISFSSDEKFIISILTKYFGLKEDFCQKLCF
jgi:hypothetical protein